MKNAQHRPSLREVVRLIGPRGLLWMFIGIAASLTLSATEAAITIFLQMFLKTLGISMGDIASPIGHWDVNQTELILLLVLIGIAKAVGTFLVCQSAIVTNESINSRLRLLLFHSLLGDKNPTQSLSAARLTFMLSELFPKAARFCEAAGYLIASLVTAGTLAILMFTYGWREACIGLSGLLLVGILVVLLNRKVSRAASQIPHAQKTMMTSIERIARNWLLVRILRTRKHEYDKLADNILTYSASSFRAGFYTYLGAVMPPFLGVLLLVVIISLHLTFWPGDGLAFISFLYLFIRFSQYVGTIASMYGGVTINFPQFLQVVDDLKDISGESLNEATSQSRRISPRGSIKQEKQTSTPLTGSLVPLSAMRPPTISLRDVCYAYDPSAPLIVGISIEIGAGEHFGIVGKSGSGKSTLLAIILGIFKPQTGNVEIDGTEPTAYFDSPLVRVGYVGADPFLFEGTVRQNMSYGLRNTVSDADYWIALEKARLSEVIRKLPKGLDQPLGDNGEGLSAGQKQRLALARAFLSQPPLMILDEVSANLDERTEEELSESLAVIKGVVTVLIVSHRPGILKHADRVLNLETIKS